VAEFLVEIEIVQYLYQSVFTILDSGASRWLINVWLGMVNSCVRLRAIMRKEADVSVNADVGA